MTASGRATVERGTRWRARVAAWLLRLPAAGAEVPVEVMKRRRADVETWRREFAGRAFASRHGPGAGRHAGLVVERFGPFAFGLAVSAGDGALRLRTACWSVCGIPLPRALMPVAHASETAADGRFRFEVAIAIPGTGPVVRYRGWLVPEA